MDLESNGAHSGRSSRHQVAAWLRPSSYALGIVAGYLILPVAGWILLCLAVMRIASTTVTVSVSFLGFLPIALAINWSKEIESDWSWYSAQFLQYPHFSLVDIFGRTFHPRANDLEEPLYYILSWTTAQVFGANLGALNAVIVIWIYGCLSFAVGLIGRYLQLSPSYALVLHFMMLSLGFVFTLSTHLVRQQMALASVIVAVAFLLGRKGVFALIALAVGIGFHTSAVVVALAIGVGVWVSTQRTWRLLVTAITSGLAAGFAFWLFIGRGYEGQSAGGVSPLWIILDVLVVVGLLALRTSVSLETRRILGGLPAVMLTMLFFALANLTEPTPALRFYLYLAPFSALGAFLIGRIVFGIIFPGILPAWLVAGSGVISVVLMQLRVYESDFTYALNFLDLLP